MESTALLVIDEQIGAFDGKLVPPIHDGDQLLNRTQKLIGAARASAIPVVFVQHCATEGLLVQGTEAWDIHPAIAPMNNEHVVLKQESSAFDATDLRRILTDEGVHTVVTCGLQSEHCVFNTSFSALELDFTVYVASDAHSTWPTEDESAATIIQRQNQALADRGAKVESTSDLIALLKP